MAIQLSDQVCSLIQAKRLKELGVVQKSTWYHKQYMFKIEFDINDGHWEIHPFVHEGQPFYSAYNVAELGIAIGTGYYTYIIENSFCHVYNGADNALMFKTDFPTEAQARAELLIYLIENKIVSVEEINERLK